MRKLYKFFILIFVLFVKLSDIYALDDCHFINNNLMIKKVKFIVLNKFKNEYYFGCDCSVFVLNQTKFNEAFILVPVYDHQKKFIKEIAIKVNIKKFGKSALSIISDKDENISINRFDIDNECKFLKTKNISKFAELSYVKQWFDLKIDFNKNGRVYYTVPSEDKLDDIHMIYESKDGKERKEFVFTKSGIIPIDDTIGWQIQNGWNKFRNFFSFSTKHEEVKNEGYDCDNEKTRLKEKIY